VKRAEDEKDLTGTGTMGGGFVSGVHKPSSGKERTLQGVPTFLYIGTEVGSVNLYTNA
jgi:hypothetical protein